MSTGTRFGVVTGRATSLLVAERVALNFVQRMSGIATATAVMSQAVKVSMLEPPSLLLFQIVPSLLSKHLPPQLKRPHFF